MAKSHLSLAQEQMRRALLTRKSHPATALEKQVGGDHYKMPIQHAEFCQRNRLSWCESAAIKYIVRHQRKGGKQDLLKAIHYLEILIQLEYPEAPETKVSSTSGNPANKV